MIRVKATREGLLNQKMATGVHIDGIIPFVALPSDAALRQWIWVINPLNGRKIKALVLDIGPWNTHDNAYVFGGARPQAESGKDSFGRITNLAGIDLSEAVWNFLQMEDNTDVEWEFA